MEINLKKLRSEAAVCTTERKKMRLSENAQNMVFQLFTKNVYSNPIGTVVREITSNCFDSHVEAKVNSPVIIRKSKDIDTNNYHISFIDYGVGMSPDRIENIYGVYFESTKRIDNTQIGGFGIGGKTPLAYKRYSGVGEAEYDNSFYVVTIFEGTKYYYCVFEGEEGPEWSLLYQEATKEHNGTEIRIPVLEKDINSFEKEMVRQLYYFENIIFEGFEGSNSRYEETLTNEYTIIRGKNFLFRGTEYSSNMHACLGRVAYPIDFSTLGLDSSDYQLPLAVKLEVGEINVTVSRESLDYSEATIKILKKKVESAKNEIIELLAKQYSNIVTLEEYFNVKNEFGTLKFSNGMSMYVGRLIEQKDINFAAFRYNFMKMPNDKQLFKFFFEVKSYGKKPSKSRYSSKYEFEGGYKELKESKNILCIENEFNRKIVKQAYLKEMYELYHIFKRRNLCDIFMRNEIAELFNVHLDKLTDDNGKPVTYIQSLIEMQDEYFEIVKQYAENYDTLVIPDDFVAKRKRKNGLSPELRNTTIPVKYIGHYSKQRTKLDDLFNYNMPIFYGTQEDEQILQKIYDIYYSLFDRNAVAYYDEYQHKFCNGYNSYSYTKKGNVPKKNSILFIILSANNIKYMEYCKKAYKPNEFFTRLLYRKENKVKLYFQTYELKAEWDRVEGIYKLKEFEKISAKWGKKINEVSEFIKLLPAATDNENIGYMKADLSQYFDLSNLTMSAEQKRILRIIGEILKLQENNYKIVSYVHVYGELKDDTLINILKKIMIL